MGNDSGIMSMAASVNCMVKRLASPNLVGEFGGRGFDQNDR